MSPSKFNLAKVIESPTVIRDNVFLEKPVFMGSKRTSLVFSKNDVPEGVSLDQFDKCFELSLYLIKRAIERLK